MNGSADAATPHAAFVDGLLDGRIADAARLRAAADALGRAGAGAFRCDLQGGRFTVLPVETRIAAPFDVAAQERFLEALRELVATAAPGSVETNLRCRLVFADEVAETLFVVRGQQVEPLTRRRPRTAADGADLAPEPALGVAWIVRRRELVWLAPLLLVLAAFAAWQTGWIDRVLAARAESLRVDAGPFGAMLDASVQRSWGDYEVTLRRGRDYPDGPQAVAERLARLPDTAQHAACSIVGDGRDLYVQLLDDGGKVLAEAHVEVRALLTAADGCAVARLPGQMHAASLRLAIAAARPQ